LKNSIGPRTYGEYILGEKDEKRKIESEKKREK